MNTTASNFHHDAADRDFARVTSDLAALESSAPTSHVTALLTNLRERLFGAGAIADTTTPAPRSVLRYRHS